VLALLGALVLAVEVGAAASSAEDEAPDGDAADDIKVAGSAEEENSSSSFALPNVSGCIAFAATARPSAVAAAKGASTVASDIRIESRNHTRTENEAAASGVLAGEAVGRAACAECPIGLESSFAIARGAIAALSAAAAAALPVLSRRRSWYALVQGCAPSISASVFVSRSAESIDRSLLACMQAGAGRQAGVQQCSAVQCSAGQSDGVPVLACAHTSLIFVSF
jgi:hypothetical protein